MRKTRRVLLLISILLLLTGCTNNKQAIIELEKENSILKKEIENLKVELDEFINEEDVRLAEKVIIQAFEEFSKLGTSDSEDEYENLKRIVKIKGNVELVKNSYSSDDGDVINMLNLVYDYLDSMHIYYLDPSNPIVEQNSLERRKQYVAARKALDSCISKYALFDKVGLE